jgi:hypothetical protein
MFEIWEDSEGEDNHSRSVEHLKQDERHRESCLATDEHKKAAEESSQQILGVTDRL